MTATTIDGAEVVAGLRVFTNDWAWGTVIKTCAESSPIVHGYCTGPDDCWHSVQLDSGRVATYNRDRLTTRKPVTA